jgi:hypothetical protein
MGATEIAVYKRSYGPFVHALSQEVGWGDKYDSPQCHHLSPIVMGALVYG